MFCVCATNWNKCSIGWQNYEKLLHGQQKVKHNMYIVHKSGFFLIKCFTTKGNFYNCEGKWFSNAT